MAAEGAQVKAGVWRVAVVADTHGVFPAALAPTWAQADEIWHLGDFCDLSTLEKFRALGPPLAAVRGNNDYSLELPERLGLERAGLRFLLVHILPRAPSGADVFLHGHTHIPADERRGRLRLLNPGTIGKPNKGVPPAWAWLELGPAPGELRWHLQPL